MSARKGVAFEVEVDTPKRPPPRYGTVVFADVHCISIDLTIPCVLGLEPVRL